MYELKIEGNIKAQLARTRSFKVTKYGTDDELTNENGEYQWQFTILAVGKYALEPIPVKVWSKTDPLYGSAMGDMVDLGACTVTIGLMPNEGGKGYRKFWNLYAGSVSLKKAS